MMAIMKLISKIKNKIKKKKINFGWEVLLKIAIHKIYRRILRIINIKASKLYKVSNKTIIMAAFRIIMKISFKLLILNSMITNNNTKLLIHSTIMKINSNNNLKSE